MIRHFRLLSTLIISCLCSATIVADTAKDLAFFEKKIRPVLVKHCYRCHSAEAVNKGRLKGGLQLDTRKGIRQGGDSGPAVVPSQPKNSLLLDALKYQKFEMPPKGKLSQQTIDDFEHWIEEGAADPRDGQPIVTNSIDFDKARQFWSLQPIGRPTIPQSTGENLSPIDHFVQARLHREGLTSTEPASPQTLIRRLYFDLIGLPPTPAVVNAFVSNHSEEAYNRLVDSLLASPHFGEKWARHWLDVARYAESNGRARNMVWHHAWRYRDYVIDAMNADMPFDQFIREQIAGDLLPANSSQQRDRQIVATGFLALGPKSLEERNRKLFQLDTVDEQIDVISRGFLGFSVSCARCHDHKFEPIPTADYYALAGIFLSTDTLYGLGPKGIKGVNDAELQPIGQHRDRAKDAAKHLEQVKEQTQKRNTARSDRYRVVRRVASMKLQLKKPGVNAETIQQEIDKLNEEIKEWDAKIKKMDEDLKHLVENPPPLPGYAMAAREQPTLIDSHIHIRGEFNNLGKKVSRGVLQVISIPEVESIRTHQSGRLQLANWIASPKNPLTTRVAVNRIWQHLFGRGLVATPDDFGINGSRPSHPQLLDYLASRFIEQRWSMKKLIREIVLSRTYQLSSAVIEMNQKLDPENIFLWRSRPSRLTVEAFRDAVMTVSGQLDLTPRSGSVIAEMNPFTQDEFNSRTNLTQEQMKHSHRSIYFTVARGKLPEILKLFDFADPNALIGKRDETSVPAQALFLMNSPWMLEQAKHTATRLLKHGQTTPVESLNQLYLSAFSRLPTSIERERALTFLRTNSEDPPLEKWTQICQVVLASLEFRYLK